MFDPRDDARDRDGREDGRERVYDERDRDDQDPRDGLMRDLDLPRGEERELVVDRDRVYELDGEDSRTLAAIGAFRVVPEHDLDLDHDTLEHLRDEGACRLLADGVDIRIIQLMLGHSSVQQTQRYLNVTDEELRKGLEMSWTRRRALRLVAGGQNAVRACHTRVTRDLKMWRARQGSNLRPSASKADALSN